VNYDKTGMPAAYDAGRGYSPGVLAYWLGVISQSVPKGSVAEILDLGCGTGRYSNALADYYDASVTAIDPSEKMLAAARRKASPRVRCDRASAESLPLHDASIDMVFISMAFHHFEHPDRAAAECRRVLHANGVVCLRAGTIERTENYAYVQFFPGSRPILNRVLQSQAFIESTFARAGFKLIRHDLVPSQAAESWEAYAKKLAYRADSILVQLSDHEFEDGLAALREHAKMAPPHERVVEPVDFFVFQPRGSSFT
jgi:ubiquinone/menaquinone biosynthesis C-methylase UbiE